jgi:hypothetical protein
VSPVSAQGAREDPDEGYLARELIDDRLENEADELCRFLVFYLHLRFRARARVEGGESSPETRIRREIDDRVRRLAHPLVGEGFHLDEVYHAVELRLLRHLPAPFTRAVGKKGNTARGNVPIHRRKHRKTAGEQRTLKHKTP